MKVLSLVVDNDHVSGCTRNGTLTRHLAPYRALVLFSCVFKGRTRFPEGSTRYDADLGCNSDGLVRDCGRWITTYNARASDLSC